MIDIQLIQIDYAYNFEAAVLGMLLKKLDWRMEVVVNYYGMQHTIGSVLSKSGGSMTY